ncbi:MAG TPA: hypothetical protein VJZ71_11570 [Phycisphaerae bacterium]|nr:hypothetical protein [Phycisphaerae bacterium]
MKPRRGPSLFDVMSKAPIAATPRERPRLSWLKRKVAAPVLSVAEALSEEEAAAELAAQHPVELPEPGVPEPRLPKPIEAEPLKLSTDPIDSDEAVESPPIFRFANGRLSLQLSTPACVAVVGVVATIALAAYVVGQRSSTSRLPPVAARANNGDPSASPLLPAPTSPQKKPSAADAALRNPDLSHLLQRPASAVNANKPAHVAEEVEARPSPGTPESLNYLQIESFLVTRERSGDVLAHDVAHVRQFLLERGVRTFARKRSNGFVLFAEQGFAPGKTTAQERAAFQRKIEQLGQEYRTAGGRYQFKGCLFVSFSSTKAGDPV